MINYYLFINLIYGYIRPKKFDDKIKSWVIKFIKSIKPKW